MGAGHSCLPEPSEQVHHSLLGTRGCPSLRTTELPPADRCSSPPTFRACSGPSLSTRLISRGPLPRAPASSPRVHSPEPPPHLPGSPPRSPRLISQWTSVCSDFPTTPQRASPSHQGVRRPSRQPLSDREQACTYNRGGTGRGASQESGVHRHT